MKAKEIFKDLGYTKKVNNNQEVIYNKLFIEEHIDEFIIFNKKEKIIEVFNKTAQNDYEDCHMPINVDELKAINKQVEELGWNK